MEPAQDLAGPGEADLHIAAALVLLLPACGEKVGMRGPFHKLRLAEGPLTRRAPISGLPEIGTI